MKLQAICLLLALGMSVMLQGCSVGMAASGHEQMDTSIALPGSNRAVIVSKLEPPETSRQLENGTIADTYLIKKGNEASSGRARAHAGLDILTSGLWEAAATPYELAQGQDTYRLVITYAQDGAVLEVHRVGAK